MSDDRSNTALSDFSRAAIMLGDVEFVSHSDGSVLIGTDPSCKYRRVDEHQAMRLFIWLSNHLRVKL